MTTNGALDLMDKEQQSYAPAVCPFFDVETEGVRIALSIGAGRDPITQVAPESPSTPSHPSWPEAVPGSLGEDTGLGTWGLSHVI